jgi:outer membrane protein OmpA-like peptidoglycan-associated protein
MSANPKRLLVNLASVVLAANLALPAGIGYVLAAEEISAGQIIEALKPPRVTRSLTLPADVARAAEEARFVDGLRNRVTRSLTTYEREKITAIAKTRSSIDIPAINFRFNAATIDTNDAKTMTQLDQLATALAHPQMKGATVLLAGHTDAKGSDTYNQGLSERRAEAVRQFLSANYNIERGTLLTVGHGKTQLKNTANPFADENRRVQVVNMMADK